MLRAEPRPSAPSAAPDADGWVPAFPGQRPPFKPGNKAAVGHDVSKHLRHGARSPRIVDPIATQLVEDVLAEDSLAYLREPRWRFALMAWARAEAQVQLVAEYLAKKAEQSGDALGDLTDETVRSAYALLHKAEARASTGRTRLGLDPLSRARLGRDTAATSVDVARLMAQLEHAEKERSDAE